LKANDHARSLLLFFTGVYRVLSLIAVFALILVSGSTGRGGAINSFQIKYLIFLSLGTVFYFVLLKHEKILSILLAAEYFTVFFYAYVEPYSLVLELIWIPGIIMALSLILPGRAGVFIIPGFGIIGSAFFSYGHINGEVISIGRSTLPYTIAALFLYVPVTLSAILLGRICFRMEEMEKRHSSLETENKRFNEINHAISQRIFSLQNDTTQKERNRLSKEIHDTAGYVFINLIMMLQAASAVLYKDIKKTDKLIGDARDYAERGINEIRHLLKDIRDYIPARLSLQNELHNVGESFQKATDVEIDIEYGVWPGTFSKNLDSFFISFMQEALTNALKHGHAAKVSVLCWDNGSHTGMTITDNGGGAEFPIKKGIGITAMEDVANQLEGAITIKNVPEGFKISAAIPNTALNAN
jgi:signal transduction histidine kinase